MSAFRGDGDNQIYFLSPAMCVWVRWTKGNGTNVSQMRLWIVFIRTESKAG